MFYKSVTVLLRKSEKSKNVLKKRYRTKKKIVVSKHENVEWIFIVVWKHEIRRSKARKLGLKAWFIPSDESTIIVVWKYTLELVMTSLITNTLRVG